MDLQESGGTGRGGGIFAERFLRQMQQLSHLGAVFCRLSGQYAEALAVIRGELSSVAGFSDDQRVQNLQWLLSERLQFVGGKEPCLFKPGGVPNAHSIQAG